MKWFKNIWIFIGMAVISVSCNDWLDQKPFDKVSGDELYATEEGAREALNGLYLGLLDRSLYGGEMTAGLLEVLAGHYYVPESEHKYSIFMAASPYATSDAKSYLSNIWSKMYKLIAECNVFLERIEMNQDHYNAANYKLYKGEALALRTFLHFDLLRLFGPACTEENTDKRAIPYYDEEVELPMPYLTVAQMEEQLVKDLDAAIVLLADDPIYDGTDLAFQAAGFWGYRNFRMSIYAAYALKARMCLYFGDKTTAYTIASALLKGKDPETQAMNNFEVSFPSYLSLESDYREPVMFSEVVFGMHDIDREALHKKYFSVDLENKEILMMSRVRLAELFPDIDADCRYGFYGDGSEKSENEALCTILKYQSKSLSAKYKFPYQYEVIPLLKKGELILIAAETSPDDVYRLYWLAQLSLQRGHQQGAVVGDLEQYIQDEYEREFYGEGQYFFFLKRNARTSFQLQSSTSGKTNVKKVGTDYYIFPAPDAEEDNRV